MSHHHLQILLFRLSKTLYAYPFLKKQQRGLYVTCPSFGLLCLSPRLWLSGKSVSLFSPPIGLLHKYGDRVGLVSYMHNRNVPACQRITKKVKNTHELAHFSFYRPYIWHKVHLTDSRRYMGGKSEVATIFQKQRSRQTLLTCLYARFHQWAKCCINYYFTPSPVIECSAR